MQHITIYPGAILELETTLMKLKAKTIFLVTGKESFESCGAKGKLKGLYDKYEVTHFNDFQTNPDSEDVLRGVELFNRGKCELLISVGGGSVIDMAKLINYYHNARLNAIVESNIKNKNFSPVTHICLPTTAGSGSEATHFAVMYIGDSKYSVAHEKLIPKIAIIDPELHYSQTPYQKAVSGTDALAQAIESFWSIQSTEESRLYSEKALELVWNNLPKVVHESDNTAHLKLAVGANLAGRAINIAKTTAPHALAYGFTKKIGLPHGHAVAITIAPFFEFNLNGLHKKLGLSKIKTIMLHIINCDNIYDARNEIEHFISRLGIETKLSKISTFNKSELITIIKYVNMERLSNNPIPISTSDLSKILDDSY